VASSESLLASVTLWSSESPSLSLSRWGNPKSSV
jgi:hypothetical protein